MNDPYGTHRETLMWCAFQRKIKRVLELGCGQYSTPLFLNRMYFPYLEELVSMEHNQTWADSVMQRWKDDRLKMHIVADPVTEFPFALRDFDLIFIDNSDSWPGRLKTIEAVGRSDVGEALVVLHDWEYLPYQDCANNYFSKVLVEDKVIPQTAVMQRKYA